MSRTAKPIATLLKMKQIKPSIEFTGSDKIAYEDFLAEQAELSLLNVIKDTKPKEEVEVKKEEVTVEEAPKPKKRKTSTRRKSTRKVKQNLDPEIVTTGAMETVNEEFNHRSEESI